MNDDRMNKQPDLCTDLFIYGLRKKKLLSFRTNYRHSNMLAVHVILH